jgi:hypothetical protein
MPIFKIEQTENQRNYTAINCIIVIADNEEEARQIHPSKSVFFKDGKWIDKNHPERDSNTNLGEEWIQAKDIHLLKLEKIQNDHPNGVILSSHHYIT